MFFHLSKTAQLNFVCHYRLGEFVLSTDAGWQDLDLGRHQVVYKGYADDAAVPDLLEQILAQQEPELLGNFCVIAHDTQTGTISFHTDRYRSFPLWYKNHECVTNLVPNENTAWTDSLLTVEADGSVIERKFDVVGHIDVDQITVDDLINQVTHILDTKTQNFLSHNKLPIRAHLSGGVDSLLVYSFLQKFDRTHELIKYRQIQYDKFWLLNSGTVQRFWAYNQIHHWTDPCILTSGAPGDEFMLRSPSTTDYWLKTQGFNVLDLLKQDKWKECLHSSYFYKPQHQDIFNNQKIVPDQSPAQVAWHLCNIVVNDWQHWHLGNTLTWTPLRDLRIFKLFLRLPVDAALGQILDSRISRQLIENNGPGLSDLISDQKNSGNPMANLCDFLFQHRG